MMSKYKAKRTEYEDRVYDSGLEARVAEALDTLRDGSLDGCDQALFIDEQVPFTLIPKSRFGRAIVYKADFVVIFAHREQDFSRRIVIEVKGFQTPVWRLKERLFREKYPSTDLRVVSGPEDVMEIARESWQQ